MPYLLLAIGLLLVAYVTAYFLTSDLVTKSRESGPFQQRVFSGAAAHRVFRPLTWIESRFDQDRGFSHRKR
jgi:hypothetical protein